MNGTVTIVQVGPYPYTSPMTATLIGYVRWSIVRQDLVAQRQARLELGAAEDRIYTGRAQTRPLGQGSSRMPAPSPISFSNEV